MGCKVRDEPEDDRTTVVYLYLLASIFHTCRCRDANNNLIFTNYKALKNSTWPRGKQHCHR